MALEAPLRSSTGSVMSAFSPHTDLSISSPDSPAVHSQFMPFNRTSAGSVDSQSLRPTSAMRAHSANFHLMSPGSDLVGPSPVTSNGTETTEIEDEPADDALGHNGSSSMPQHRQLTMLRTNVTDEERKAGQESVSVIHAPESFGEWPTSNQTPVRDQEPNSAVTEDSLISESVADDVSYSKVDNAPPPISTNVKPVGFSLDGATPQAQNLQEVLNGGSRVRSSSASSLELIPENSEAETQAESAIESTFDDEDLSLSSTAVEHSELNSLRTALEECWTLCNTLSTLSTHHREQVFNSSGTPDAHEKAWKTCWKLCQRLYHSRDDTIESFNVRTNLDLCRDFCQALFDVRQRKDEVADSVLRVSFELNNHLYSAQDNRNLPEAFRERTLDFYITLCHRLMKQRSELAEETDSLLRACWSLAEMLFSLRQNKREGRPLDEELLGSAVQACWDLCDIFRDGWTQIRPDRGTPRPSQVNFSINAVDVPSTAGSRTSVRSKRESLKSVPEDRPSRKHAPPVPETPVTEFEDTPISPESRSPQLQNIMVLGTNNSDAGRSTGAGGGGRWSSSASNLSGYSQGSAKTSSTATTATSAEDSNITRIKVLILKAAMNSGFSRDAADGHGGGAASLQAFVKSLPTGSFGSLPAHATLLQNYKNLVLADPAFRASLTLPVRGRRLSAVDAAKSVSWMTLRSPQYGFLRDLFKLVFGFLPDDADARKTISIAV